jgi:hypothetical protein
VGRRGRDILTPMDADRVRDELKAGHSDAKFKSHGDAIRRALVHGSIIGVAVFYPAAIWKRVVGALVAFFLVGVISQYRAIRRERLGKR